MDSSPAYLRRPLYLYDLPTELLDTLVLQIKQTSQSAPNEDASTYAHQRQPQNEDGVSNSTACALCRATFRNVDEQRQHVRSDFHRYNLKIRIKGLPAIDEQTFIKQIGDLDESISGSDSSEFESEEEANQNDTTLTALLKRQAKLSNGDAQEDGTAKTRRGPGNAPMYWLTSPKLPAEHGLGVYRAVFTAQEQDNVQSNIREILRQKQLKPVQAKHNQSGQPIVSGANTPHFFLCMVGGGHFAAAVVGLAPEIRRGQGGIEERHAMVKAHKTFHRYTTRRKQGGSQSANDNAKGNAHSVGSSIRRANEAALVDDIRRLLSEWKTMIDAAELIFVRATGSQNRNILFGEYDGRVITSRDPRVRGFPFSTRRATQNELLRAFQELTRVKLAQLVQQEEEKSVEPAVPKVKSNKPTPPKLTPEEEEALLHTSQLQNLIRRSKAPAVLLYLNKNNIPSTLRFHPPNEGPNHHAPTPLHLAASSNSAAVVIALLTKAHADPSIKNDDGKTPYDIAGDTKTRDAFRIARHTLGESAVDWSAAHVPSALSPEEAEAKSKQEQVSAAQAEADRRKADLERIRQDEEGRKIGKIENKAGPGKTLNEKTWTDQREEEARGLTPEMRMRLERERRARAAEARMKALAGRQ